MPSNYADDNTCTVIGTTKEETLELVKKTVSRLANWFDDNMMKANIDKFQFLFLSPARNSNDSSVTVTFENLSLTSQDEAKLLGFKSCSQR